MLCVRVGSGRIQLKLFACVEICEVNGFGSGDKNWFIIGLYCIRVEKKKKKQFKRIEILEKQTEMCGKTCMQDEEEEEE